MPTSDTKICPFCAEEIKKAAIVCKHCGRELPGFDDQYSPQNEKTTQNQEHRRIRGAKWGFGVITGIIFTIIFVISRLPGANTESQNNALAFRPQLFELTIQSIFIFLMFTMLGVFVNWLWRIDWRIVGGVSVALIAIAYQLGLGKIDQPTATLDIATPTTMPPIFPLQPSLINQCGVIVF